MQSKKIGLKLCGHCSPRRDMAELVEELRESAKDMEFVYYLQDAAVKELLIMNACGSACAHCPSFTGSVITVTPETVDRWPVEQHDMKNTILTKLRSASV